MADQLSQHGVTLLALSKDSAKEAANHKQRDGLNMQLLSDPDLKVIKQYGLEHHKALEFSTARFTLFGIPLALAPSVKTMAAPTTLLIDEERIVRWIDQADDYRIRSDNQRVLSASEQAVLG